MRQNSLIKKFLSFSIGNWLGIIVGVISTPIVTRFLSPKLFGKASMFRLALNVVMIFVVFGTDQTFVRFFYEEDPQNRKKLLFKSLKVPFGLFVITFIIMLGFKDEISLLLFDEVSQNIIYLLIVAILLQMLNRFALLVIRMEQKGFWYSMLQFLLKLIKLFGIILFTYMIGKKYQVIPYAQVIAIAITLFGAIWIGRKFWDFRDLNDKKLNNNLRDILEYSYPLVITTLITWLFQSFDRIAIKHWATFSELGLYTAAFKIVALLNVIKTSFSNFWVPVRLERYENNPNDKSFFKRMYKFVSIGMFIVALGLIMTKDLVIYILGSQYRQSAMIMPFLVLMPMMYTISETTVIGISFAKKPKWNILIAGVSCIVNVLGNSILVPRIGAKGAAISTGLSYVVFFTMRTIISLKYYKVNYELKKFYLMLLLLISYATYASFYQWNIINLFIGLIILSIVLGLNYNFIKINLLDEFNCTMQK
ncbi:oligosaccharide flippase family protein [Halanaerocella petrolearia]